MIDRTYVYLAGCYCSLCIPQRKMMIIILWVELLMGLYFTMNRPADMHIGHGAVNKSNCALWQLIPTSLLSGKLNDTFATLSIKRRCSIWANDMTQQKVNVFFAIISFNPPRYSPSSLSSNGFGTKTHCKLSTLPLDILLQYFRMYWGIYQLTPKARFCLKKLHWN